MDAQSEQLVIKKNENKSIGYIRDFKNFVNEHPRVLNDVKNCIQVLSKEVDQEVIRDGGLYVQKVVSQIGSSQVGLADRYKITAYDKSFFVKKIEESFKGGRGDGFWEFETTVDIKKRIEDLGIDGVEVVNFQFGFSDGTNSYFVSEWDERLAVTLQEYRRQLKKDSPRHIIRGRDKEKLDTIISRFNELKKYFPDLVDFDLYQANYDEKTDTIILFDLNFSSSSKNSEQ